MNTLHNLTGAVYSMWLSFVKFILPDRFKRFIILTTIFQKGFDEQIFDNVNFKSINNRLQIASSVEAMQNISMIAPKLWSNVELKTLLQTAVHCDLNGECISLRDAGGIGEIIFDNTPKWLRYDKQSLIQDISSLLSTEKIHFSATV